MPTDGGSGAVNESINSFASFDSLVTARQDSSPPWRHAPSVEVWLSDCGTHFTGSTHIDRIGPQQGPLHRLVPCVGEVRTQKWAHGPTLSEPRV